MRRISRFRVACWIHMATCVGLLGCPQLLDDRFATRPDAGGLCLDSECGVPRSGGPGGEGGRTGSSGADGLGGSDAGSGNWGSSGDWGGYGSSRGSSGDWGGYGSWGGAGSSGSGSAGTGGSSGEGGTAGSGAGPACWTMELSDTTHDSSSNCIGIVGWNNVTTASPTTLSLNYQDGDPCFTGSIGSGWAVYDLMFAPDNETWNATTHGVTGFEFASRGPSPPASLRVLYKDPGGVDFCRVIAPGVTAVPFSDAHPSCSTSASSSVVDTTGMVEIILDFVPASSQPYLVNFCLQITALD